MNNNLYYFLATKASYTHFSSCISALCCAEVVETKTSYKHIFLFIAALQNDQGHSPLQLACMAGSLTSVGVLLDHGARPEYEDTIGRTAADIADLYDQKGKYITITPNVLGLLWP